MLCLSLAMRSRNLRTLSITNFSFSELVADHPERKKKKKRSDGQIVPTIKEKFLQLTHSSNLD